MLSGMILKEAREVMLYKREESIVCEMALARHKERGWSLQMEVQILAEAQKFTHGNRGRECEGRSWWMGRWGRAD